MAVKSKIEKTKKMLGFSFGNVVFVLGFMSLFLVCFSIAVQLTNMAPSYAIIQDDLNSVGAWVALSIMILLVTLILVNGVYPRTLIFQFPLISQIYPPLYFAYQLAFIMALAFVYTEHWMAYAL